MAEMDSGRVQYSPQRKPALPPEDNMERIRRRAREIWEQHGRPEGCEQDHWRQAEEEILGTNPPR